MTVTYLYFTLTYVFERERDNAIKTYLRVFSTIFRAILNYTIYSYINVLDDIKIRTRKIAIYTPCTNWLDF